MFRRRRPLLRAAAVGGAGYAVGRRRQRLEEEEAERDARLDELEYQQAAAQHQQAASSGAITDATIEELRKLASLKEDGILTETEFEEQKQKLLGGG